jgi:hypothetical protein
MRPAYPPASDIEPDIERAPSGTNVTRRQHDKPAAPQLIEASERACALGEFSALDLTGVPARVRHRTPLMSCRLLQVGGQGSPARGIQSDLLWQQNTATKRLTIDMLDGVFWRARDLLGS